MQTENPFPFPYRVLMGSPQYFQVVDVKNTWMSGQQGNVDTKKAQDQWQALHDIYQELVHSGELDELQVLDSPESCEDFVFAANQSFPFVLHSGEKVVVMSRMKHESRQREVNTFREFYEKQGYRTIPPPGNETLEGMGDLIPVPGRRHIFGGFGHRTEKSVLSAVSALLDVEITPLELVSDHFYHLDTCFIPLNDQVALACREAFSPEGWQTITSYFPTVENIPAEEAASSFALNAHVIHGRKNRFAIIQPGAPHTVSVLEKHGFRVITTDTSEFMKSGGSVFCMKMMWY